MKWVAGKCRKAQAPALATPGPCARERGCYARDLLGPVLEG